MAKQLSSEPVSSFQFSNAEVAEKYVPVGVTKDFQIRVPSKKWYGNFSTVTPEIADQLIKEKYNRIKVK